MTTRGSPYTATAIKVLRCGPGEFGGEAAARAKVRGVIGALGNHF